MAFENLRRNRNDEVKKAFCMNCGAELAEQGRDFVTRRFCSTECWEAYRRPREE